MSVDGPILVTGATGNVGRHLLTELPRYGLGALAATRRPQGPGERLLDFDRPETFSPALDGVGGVFLVRPPAISDVRPTLLRFLDQVRVPVVFLSVEGADHLPVPHRTVERALADRPHTLLRPGFFAQNLGQAYLEDIRDDRRLFVPAGAGRAAFVDARDIAEVAAMAFAEPDEHLGQAWTLTGSEALGFDDVARLLTTALGEPVTYTPASLPAYLAHLERRGLGRDQRWVQAALHLGLRLGASRRVDPTAERLLGRRARALEDYIDDHLETWRPR